MASEQVEGETVQVEVPAGLADWLEARTDALDVEPATLLLSLLASYRATAELDVDFDGDAVEIDLGASANAEELVEPFVAAAVRGGDPTEGVAVDDATRADLMERVERIAAEAATAAVAEDPATAATADRLDGIETRLAAVEDDLEEKVEDVRSRVIEVKRDADAKAPADHDHDHEAVGAVDRRLSDLEDEIAALGDAFSDLEEGSTPARLDAVEADLEDVEDRLTTVAWIVRDLREAQESEAGDAALEELKREAAAADVARARCENCGEGVDIGLLTEPACPHCEATVSTVEAASSFFSKPTLRVASQLTAGADE